MYKNYNIYIYTKIPDLNFQSNKKHLKNIYDYLNKE